MGPPSDLRRKLSCELAFWKRTQSPWQGTHHLPCLKSAEASLSSQFQGAAPVESPGRRVGPYQSWVGQRREEPSQLLCVCLVPTIVLLGWKLGVKARN